MPNRLNSTKNLLSFCFPQPCPLDFVHSHDVRAQRPSVRHSLYCPVAFSGGGWMVNGRWVRLCWSVLEVSVADMHFLYFPLSLLYFLANTSQDELVSHSSSTVLRSARIFDESYSAILNFPYIRFLLPPFLHGRNACWLRKFYRSLLVPIWEWVERCHVWS